MIFGVPPPNQNPELEAYDKRTPRERLQGTLYALAVVTFLLIVAAIVTRIL